MENGLSRNPHVALSGLLSCALLAVIAACQTAPVSYMAPVPQTARDEAYSCALGTINGLGFDVLNADREAGVISAERPASGSVTGIFGNSTLFDHIIVSIVPHGNGGNAMRVTAGSAQSGAVSTTVQAPQETAIAAAQAILLRCTNQ